MAFEDRIKELIAKRAEARLGGGTERIESQHAQGKYTARERLNLLLDDASLEETDMFVSHRCMDFGLDDKTYYSDGVVTGSGTIDGRLVYVFSQDFTVFGGSLSEMYASKICKIMDAAVKTGVPVIGLYDSGGARIQEGIKSLGGFAEIVQRNIRASGVIPQISGVFGPCAGSVVFSPALTDLILMTKYNSYMYINGPKLIRDAFGDEVDQFGLGDAMVHTAKSGVAHFACEDEHEQIMLIRKLLSYMPQNNLEEPPVSGNSDPIGRLDDSLNYIVPENPKKPYDVKDVIYSVVDHHEFVEIQRHFAPNLVIGFARFNGFPAGIVANQPSFLAGVLDINSARKGARFVRMCDAFNIPIVTFVDVPGSLPGTKQEYSGSARTGAKLLFAYGEATVPKVTIILRKAYGGAYDVMGSKHLNGDINYAWPSAEIAVMGPKGAIEVLYGRELSKKDANARAEFMKQLEEEYQEKFANPYNAARYGYIDDVIEPRNTRFRIIRALQSLANKREQLPARKHCNIPL